MNILSKVCIFPAIALLTSLAIYAAASQDAWAPEAKSQVFTELQAPELPLIPVPEGLDLASSEPAALRAPAPPLTYAQIRGVRSSDSGNAWVIVSDGAFNSGFNHGGAQMFVLVIEIGYGNSIVARMNGAVLPTSANVLNERKCNVGGFLGDCSPGQTVVGWYRYFDVSGAQGGLFQYQNTSINAPFNTLSDRLTIL